MVFLCPDPLVWNINSGRTAVVNTGKCGIANILGDVVMQCIARAAPPPLENTPTPQLSSLGNIIVCIVSIIS